MNEAIKKYNNIKKNTDNKTKPKAESSKNESVKLIALLTNIWSVNTATSTPAGPNTSKGSYKSIKP